VVAEEAVVSVASAAADLAAAEPEEAGER